MFGRVVIGAAAIAVLAFSVSLVLGAEYFPAAGDAGALPRHVVLLVVATLAVSLLHVGACVVAHRRPPRLLTVLFVGVAARLILLFGAPGPVLEGDRERLRFDGRMVNLGLNPYEFKASQLGDPTPSDALLDTEQLDRLRHARATLSAGADGPRPEALRRPDRRTEASPLSLWIAALADRLKPQSSIGYAFMILCADVLAGFLLILALRALHLPLGWLLIYAWCPVLLREGYVTYSVDMFLMPALAGLVYCIASSRKLMTALPMAICIALRPATLLLLPIVGRRVGILPVLLAVLLSVVPLLPFQSPSVPVGNYAEGPVHTWRYYEYNSALENSLRGVLKYVPYRAENSLTIAGVEIVRPDEKLDALLAKVCCLIALLGVVTYAVIRLRPDTGLIGAGRSAAMTDMFIILAALLFVSPVLKPSHALWLLPILVLRPMGISWLMLPGLLSISYLTHLVGPDAADLTLPGGLLSFRVFEFGALLALLVVDAIWGRSMFLEPDETAAKRREIVQIEHELEYRPDDPALV